MSTVTFTELTAEEWKQKYKPKVNYIDPNASFSDENGQGIMYETFGDELQYVAQHDIHNVWTYLDADGTTVITNGFSFVNRLGYFVTEVPWNPQEEIQITISVDECAECEKPLDDCDCSHCSCYCDCGEY